MCCGDGDMLATLEAAEMKRVTLGSISEVSRLTLGGGGLGELDQAVTAEAAGPLDPNQIAEIDGLRLRNDG